MSGPDYHPAAGCGWNTRHNEAVLRQVAAIPQNNAAHVAHTQAVHHDAAGGNIPRLFHMTFH